MGSDKRSLLHLTFAIEASLSIRDKHLFQFYLEINYGTIS